MKVLFLFLALYLSIAAVFAQEAAKPAAPADLTVIKNKWKLRVRHSERIALASPVYAGEDSEAWRQQIPEKRFDSERKNRDIKNYLSIYELKVKNDGQKTIQKTVWKYQFFKSGAAQPITERTLYNFEKIKPGATKDLLLPTRVMPFASSEGSEKIYKAQIYLEKAVIQTIEYTDGTVWTAEK